MMAFVPWLIVFLHVLCINGFNKNCNTNNECAYNNDNNNNPIDCPDNEDCLINCSGLNSCQYSTINCPINGHCHVQCTNKESCKGIIINATPNTLLNITCTGADNTDTDSCRDSIINGALNTFINIHCGRQYACYGSTIDARYASKLQMMDCATDFWTCYKITVWCPQNVNGEKRCIIQGDNSVGGESGEAMKLYAVNSWRDIDFQTPSKTNDYFGTMYCTTGILTGDFSNSCNIDESGPWECSDPNSICQDPPTYSPTISPTTDTQSPGAITPEPTLITTSPTTATPGPTLITASPTSITPAPTSNTASPTYSTQSPTTKAPTTKSPTTKGPTTKGPTTKGPTTKGPTTSTSTPTTKTPTTKPPTTKLPTSIPTISPTMRPTATPKPTEETRTLEVDTKETTKAIENDRDGEANEGTQSTTTISTTDKTPKEDKQDNSNKENFIMFAVRSYGIYMIIAIILLCVGCCCLIWIIHKRKKSKFTAKYCDDNDVEMINIDNIGPKPKKKRIKKSPLGMALNINNNHDTIHSQTQSNMTPIPPTIQNINFSSSIYRERIASQSTAQSMGFHGNHLNSMSFHGNNANSMSFGMNRMGSVQSGPPELVLSDNSVPPSIFISRQISSVSNAEIMVHRAHNDEEVVGSDHESVSDDDAVVTTPRGNHTMQQTPFGNDNVDINNNNNNNNNNNKSPYDIIDTGIDGEYHIDLDVDELNVDVDDDDDDDDDDDVIRGDKKLTLGANNNNNDDDDDDDDIDEDEIDVLNAINTLG